MALPALTSCRTGVSRSGRRPGAGSRINLGLIGFGTMAQETTPNFLADPRVQIVAVADPVAELGNYGSTLR